MLYSSNLTLAYKENAEKKNLASIGNILQRSFFVFARPAVLKKHLSVFTSLIFGNLLLLYSFSPVSCYSSEKVVRDVSLKVTSLSHGTEAKGRLVLMPTNCFLFPCEPPGKVADLWFEVVPHRRTIPAL